MDETEYLVMDDIIYILQHIDNKFTIKQTILILRKLLEILEKQQSNR